MGIWLSSIQHDKYFHSILTQFIGDNTTRDIFMQLSRYSIPFLGIEPASGMIVNRVVLIHREVSVISANP